MKIIRKILLVFILAVSIFIAWINLRLYADNFTRNEKQHDIILQLNFLENELKNNDLGERMQSIFPEGFVFTNALYGLSWCECGITGATNSYKNRALHEALFAYNQINSEKARSIFDHALQPENGIYYLGWNNYLLSKILLLDSNFVNHSAYEKIFSKQCELISNTLKQSKSPFLQSYENACWPADMCVAMASISNYDKIYKQPKYQNLITEWISNIKRNPDPTTQMIPHAVNALNGETIEGARGSSISLILRLMAEIDLPFAEEQYKLYKQNFVSTTFGLPSINEYPKGQPGRGDIDSGPVIFGTGFAATIVSVGTFSVLGDSVSAEHQYKAINSLGLSYKTNSTKKYVFGKLPIADAFIAWGRSSGLNYNQYLIPSSTYWWGLKFHLISIFIIAILWLLYYLREIFSKLKKHA